MKINVVFRNKEEIQKLIDRTEKAVEELKECVWELSKVQLEVVVDGEKK